jgi:type 1 glutamine amidotransferase
VLVLSGGAYHDFGPNLARLVEGLDVPQGAHFTFLPLGEIDPDGVPVELRRRRLETLDLPAEVDVVLAYTQGDLGLSDRARERLLAFVRDGGGFVGLHCAADSHPGWNEYTRMLGGRFASHPPYGALLVRVDGPAHLVSAGLPFEWALEDEFYHLQDLALDEAIVLMSAQSPVDGERKPVTWVKHYGEGRVVYTILGHGIATHADGRYEALVAQALEWAAGAR